MIKRLKPKSEFSRNVMTLMTGSVIAQAIPLMIAPILTRLYTPEEFGAYALIFSLVAIVTVVATARFEMAIMLPQSQKTAQSILYLSVFIAFLFSLLVLNCILIFEDTVNSYLGLNIAFLLPVFVFIAGLFQSLKMWLNRSKAYKQMAINRVEQSASTGMTQLLLGWLSVGSLGLVLGQLVGQLVAVTSIGFYAKRTKIQRPKRIDIFKAIISFKRFFYLIKFGVPALLTSRAAHESMILLVRYFMSAGIVGFISLLNRVISVPASVLGSNLGEVFYQKITETNKNKSYPIVKLFCLKLFVISMPIYLVLFLVLKYNFVLIFGETWSGALEFMPYLLIVAAFSFIFSPISMLFNYYEVQGWNLIWQSFWLISNISVFFIYEYFSFSVQELFMIYTVKQSFLYLIGILSFVIYAKKIYEK